MADNLWAISIDPDEAMREYVLLQLKVRAMRDLLFRSRIFTYLAAATPGLRELVTIGKIWEVAQPDRKVKKGREYDLVIVDAPATGAGRRVPPDAAHVREHRPRRPDQGPGGGARGLHRQPPQDGRGDRRPARGDARERDRGARTPAERGGGRRGRSRVHERALPGALLQAGAGAARRAPARRPTAPCALRTGRRSARAAGPRRSASSSPASRSWSTPPVRTLPFVFKPELGVEEIRELAGGGRADGRRRGAPRRQARLHLRGLGRGRKDDQLGRDRGRDGGARQEGRGADDRPREAARGLARPARARKRGAPGRPGPVRRGGHRDQRRRAVGDDARREGDLRRARAPPRPRRGDAGTASWRTASTSSCRPPSPARRSTWRWRSCSSFTPRTATTCWCSTRRRPATRWTSWTRPGA